MNPSGHTLLLGYDPGLDVFAGFDIVRHRTFTGRSPSVQVSVSTLKEALQHGLSFQSKSNEEIAVGIRGDLLLFYCERALDLHRLGENSTYLDTAKRVVSDDFVSDEIISSLAQDRQQVILETVRWSRSTSFRKQVLSAYDYRCAVTRRQLKLVDAAHILPVKAGERSIDIVNNGIALSPTYHRAFDNGLIFLDDKMTMRLNPTAAENLVRLGLNSGIDSFAAQLGKIHLPYNREQYPDPYFIRLANNFRGVS